MLQPNSLQMLTGNFFGLNREIAAHIRQFTPFRPFGAPATVSRSRRPLRSGSGFPIFIRDLEVVDEARRLSRRTEARHPAAAPRRLRNDGAGGTRLFTGAALERPQPSGALQGRGAMSQAYLSVDDWIERNCAPHEDCMPALRRLREQLIAGEFGVTGWRCTWDKYGRLMATDKVRQPVSPLAILDLQFACLPSRSAIVLIRNNDW